MQSTTQKQKQSSIITKPKPSPQVLSTLIKAVEMGGGIDNLQELAETISTRFNLDVTEDVLVDFYQPRICELESELLYKLYYEQYKE